MKKTYRHTGTVSVVMVAALFGLSLLFACATTTNKTHDARGLATGEPGMNTYTEAEPGETDVLARAYTGAPPLVPHSVKGLVIDRSTNDCIDCHLDGDELEEGHVATAIPPSHFVNEHTGARQEGQVTGVRYNCLQCHTPQARAAPLKKSGS